MRFLPEPVIYRRIDACLDHLRRLPEPVAAACGEPEPVHFFWEGAFTAKPALALKSFFATQDRARFACWLWLARAEDCARAAANPHLAPFLPLLTLRHFDPAAMFAGTPLATLPAPAGRRAAVPLSDLARLAILHHHGGMYSDLDVIFLRDFGALTALLAGAEACFQWSHLPRGANGFFRLHRHGAAVETLMASAARHGSAHASHLLDFQRDTVDLLVLPAAAFSPLWLQVDGQDRSAVAPFARFADFFRPFRWWFRREARFGSHRDLFPGAFTYHWHGRWSAPERRDSYAGIVAASLQATLRERHPALAALPPYGADA